MNQIPLKDSGYYFDTEKSNCNEGAKIKWDDETWSPIVQNVTETRTKCSLHFAKGKIGETYTYAYTGSFQEFVVPYDGVYKIELWGASGGEDEKSVGGKGSYTTGKIFLRENEKYYFYIGEQGKFAINYKEVLPATFNGGGPGTINTGCRFGSGGGATDIRINNGSWNDFESLKSRIMVAGGGGAGIVCDSGHYDDLSIKTSNGAPAGGINGYNGTVLQTALDDRFVNHNPPYGGTQTLGGSLLSNKDYIGSFGKSGTTGNSSSGGGGGYYGGEGGYDKSYSPSGGGGGSSFISGHQGCNAIEQSSTNLKIMHTGLVIHYSNLFFSNTEMIDGSGYEWTDQKEKQKAMPNPNGGFYNLGVGHTGNGYVRIQFLGKNI